MIVARGFVGLAIRFVLVSSIGMLTFANVSMAQGYEVQTRALAARLLQQLQAAGQQSATVLDFTDLQGQGTELGRFLAQELSDQLVAAAKSIAFVDRTNLQHLLKEQKLSVDGLINPASTKKLGNMIGIDTVIFGNVTPVGQSIRLSVRAVAVETGKIVASQAITIPSIGELADLYTHGLAESPNQADRTEPREINRADRPDSPQKGPNGKPEFRQTRQGDLPPPRRENDIRTRIRADSFKLVPQELVANTNAFYGSQLSFTIENRSGIGFGIALRADGISAGPCRTEPKVSGLPYIDQNAISRLSAAAEPSKMLRWFPPSGKISITADLDPYQCPGMVSGTSAVSLTVNFVAAVGKEVFVIPVTADKVPVRMVRGM